MSDTQVGKILVGDEQRDAIHIAVAPVVAHDVLNPGQPIGFIVDGNTELVGTRDKISDNIGIVDPFLKGRVYPGDRFYMFLNPYTITSLRHEWTHPAFEEAAKVVIPSRHPAAADSEIWIQNYANELGVKYDDLMQGAKSFQDGDEYFYGPDEYGSYGLFEGVRTHDDFWRHWEKVTGRHAGSEGNFFSCSC